MKLTWTLQARRDLDLIAGFIGRDSPAAAVRQIAVLRQTARDTLQFPHIGRLVPEADRENVRERIVGNHRLLYEVFPEEIRVVMVVEGHRLLSPDEPPDSE